MGAVPMASESRTASGGQATQGRTTHKDTITSQMSTKIMRQ